MDKPQYREVSESAFEYILSELLSIVKNGKAGQSTDSQNTQLEHIGYDIGYKYVEKVVPKNKSIGREPLDIVKFICKEFWEEVFRKKIDKLQTNHKGVFVLTELRVKWIERYTFDDSTILKEACDIISIICGILRGAFFNLGLITVVTAEYTNLPACTFNVRIKNLQ